MCCEVFTRCTTCQSVAHVGFVACKASRRRKRGKPCGSWATSALISVSGVFCSHVCKLVALEKQREALKAQMANIQQLHAVDEALQVVKHSVENEPLDVTCEALDRVEWNGETVWRRD